MAHEPADPAERKRRMDVADRFTEDKPSQATPKKDPFNNGGPVPKDKGDKSGPQNS